MSTALLAALVVMAVSAWRLGPWLWQRWTEDGGAFGHGPILLAVAIPWLVLGARRAPTSRSLWPAALLVLPASLLLWLLATRGSGSAGSLGAWLGLLALVAALGGGRMLRALFPVLGLVALSLPWPMKLVDDLSLPLKEFALRGALLLAPDGVLRKAEAAELIVGEGRLLVGDVCSGLRSSVSLLAVAWLLATMTRLRFLRFALTVLAAPLCAVLANALRVAFLIHVAAASGVDSVAPGTLSHDGSGIVAFILAGGLMFLTTRGAGVAPVPPIAVQSPPRWIPFVTASVLLLASAWMFRVPESPPLPADLGDCIARRVEVANGQWLESREVELERSTRRLLQPDGWFYRCYGPDDRYSLCIVYGASATVRIHAPEICYQGNGYELISVQELPCPDGFEECPETLHELHLQRDGEQRLCWAFYRSGHESTASYNSFVIHALLRPDAPQALLFLSTPVGPEGVAGARRELRWILRKLSSGIRDFLART